MPKIMIDQYTLVDSNVVVADSLAAKKYDTVTIGGSAVLPVNGVLPTDVGALSGMLVQPAGANNSLELYNEDSDAKIIVGMFIQTKDFSGANFVPREGIYAGGGNIPGGASLKNSKNDLDSYLIRQGLDLGNVVYIKGARISVELYATANEAGDAALAAYEVGDTIYASQAYGCVTKAEIGDPIGVVMAVQNDQLDIYFG